MKWSRCVAVKASDSGYPCWIYRYRPQDRQARIGLTLIDDGRDKHFAAARRVAAVAQKRVLDAKKGEIDRQGNAR